VIGIELINGQVMVSRSKAVLVLTKPQCIEARRRGIVCRRRHAREPPQGTAGHGRTARPPREVHDGPMHL
jgi:hypothetical protein